MFSLVTSIDLMATFVSVRVSIADQTTPAPLATMIMAMMSVAVEINTEN